MGSMQNKGNNIRQNVSRQKEVWIDESPVQQKPPQQQPVRPNVARNQQQGSKQYGYMDEHKANMINTWVEHQSSPPTMAPKQLERNMPEHVNMPVFKVLTQFKTIDSDESSEANVTNAQVHNQN